MAFKIKFPRGDTYEKGFLLKRNGQVDTDPFVNIYFTAKTKAKDSEYQFQKRLSDGGIVNDGNGHYTVFFTPEDTNGMSFREYDCDIEFVRDNFKKTFEGVLELTKESTHQNNEEEGA